MPSFSLYGGACLRTQTILDAYCYTTAVTKKARRSARFCLTHHNDPTLPLRLGTRPQGNSKKYHSLRVSPASNPPERPTPCAMSHAEQQALPRQRGERMPVTLYYCLVRRSLPPRPAYIATCELWPGLSRRRSLSPSHSPPLCSKAKWEMGSPPSQKGKRDSAPIPKGKRENRKGRQHLLRSNSTRQPDNAHTRTHAHTHTSTKETKRNNFPVGLTTKPPITQLLHLSGKPSSGKKSQKGFRKPIPQRPGCRCGSRHVEGCWGFPHFVSRFIG